MKIAYVTMQFPVPSETFASRDIAALESMGHTVSVYALRFRNPKYDGLLQERSHQALDIYHYDLATFAELIKVLFFEPKLVFSLIGWLLRTCIKSPVHLAKGLVLIPVAVSHFRRIRREKSDVVHLFWGHYPSLVGFLIKRYLPQTPVTQFLGAHDLLVRFPGSADFSYSVERVITHAEANLPMLASAGINLDKVSVIHRGIPILTPSTSIREKFATLQERPILLSAGRLIPEKGMDKVLEIFRDIRASYHDAELYLAGEGAYRQALYQAAEQMGIGGSVHFLGHLPEAELLTKMAEAHFFLLMSEWPSERLPNVIKEAMSQGCVVVTTDSPGISELVSDGRTGYVVEKTKLEDAKSHLMDCISDTKQAQLMAENAEAYVGQQFNVNSSMAKYQSCWMEALERKHRA